MIDLVTGYKGTPHITAEDEGSKNAGAFGKLVVFESVGEKLNYNLISNNAIRLLAGDIVAQGRHIRLTGYEDVTIETGTQAMHRNDLICLRYEKNTDTGIESASLVVIRGTESSGTPTDPEYTAGNIEDGDTVVEIPIYRVYINGLTVTTITPLFTLIKNYQQLQEQIDEATAEITRLQNTKAPAYTYGTEDLEAGVTPLATGTLHLVYE